MAGSSHIHATDEVHWFLDDLCSRVVAQTGIPSDRYHLGKLILQSLKDDPDFVAQIDGATGQSETNNSVLQRSIQCAVALTKLGLTKGDVIIIMGQNHLDVAIPYYAALYLGVIVYYVCMDLEDNVIAKIFEKMQPKLIFFENNLITLVKSALKQFGQEVRLISFDDNDEDVLTFSKFMADFKDNEAIENFKPVDFDTEETIALITETSGTTGVPKGTAHTHKSLRIATAWLWMDYEKFPTPIQSWLIITPMNWITASSLCLFSPILKFTRIQSSKQTTKYHVLELIDKYKPKCFLTTAPFMLALLEHKDDYDFSGFEVVRIGGSLVTKEVFNFIKKSLPNTQVSLRYGLTEAGGRTFNNRTSPCGALGQPIGGYSYRLVDIITKKDITEPNKQGELWLKGPAMFKCYYNDPEATSEAYTEDGWFKSGDIMYRDEHYNFYYVDRLKLLIRYNNYLISPLEIERVISQLPGVMSVVVTAVMDNERDELPCAFVVLRDGHNVTEQEIMDIVKDSLPDPKHLRGGVVFLKEMPMTPQLKFDRTKISELAVNLMKNNLKNLVRK